MLSLSLNWMWGRSIRWQLVGGVAILQTLLMTIFIVISVRWQQHAIVNRAAAQTQSEASLLAAGSVHALRARDWNGLSELIASLSRDDAIRDVLVTDAKGMVLSSSRSKATDEFPSDAQKRSVTGGSKTSVIFRGTQANAAAAAVVSAGQTIGWAWVSRDLATEHMDLQDIVLAGLLYTLVSVGLATAFAVFFARSILAPLRLLQEGVARFAADVLDQPIPITSANEVAVISRAFNNATAKLDDQQKQLRNEIAERAKTQQQLSDLYAAGKQEEENLRQAKLDAEESNQAKDHFLAVLSHELRTPLTPVLTLAQMLELDSSLDQAVREDITTIRRNVELEARLIDDLMDLTRIKRGKVELRLASVNVHEKLREAVEGCKNDVEAKSLELALELWAERALVQGDSARLLQVFLSLLRNAIKFTPEGGRIAIQTHRVAPENAGKSVTFEAGAAEQSDLLIDFRDTGIGIDPAMLAKIFDAFEQGNRQLNRVFGGLGLGLTISRALVQMHGGELSASSDGRDRGATFTVRLPIARVDADRAPTTRAAPASGHRRQILLVEDHADTSRLTALLLSRCGYEVQTARTVAAAIQLARSRHFDLIVSDIGLPDGTGHELIRQLVAEAPSHEMKGIAISGLGEEDDLRRSHEAGFIEHLVKPVDPAALLQAVEEVLAEPEKTGSRLHGPAT